MRAGAPSTINLEPQSPTATSMHTSNNNNRPIWIGRCLIRDGKQISFNGYPRDSCDLTLDKLSVPKLREQIIRPRSQRERPEDVLKNENWKT